MNRRILFISKNIAGPTMRYRALSYYPLFTAAGWDAQHITASSQPVNFLKIINAVKKADVVVVLRKTFQWPLLRLLRFFAKKLIFDFDDAIFVNDDGSASALRHKRFLQMLKYSDYAWAGNSYLAAQASAICPTIMLPTSIDPERYQDTAPKPTEYFDLVWIGSGSTKRYLQQVLPILEQLAKDNPQLRLKIIADFTLPTQFLKVLPIQWSAENESREIGSAHVGIAPMPDDAWTQGKCALKVIQYMAAGLPVISSPVGANQDLVIPHKTGFLAATDTDWAAAIKQLQADATLRLRLGATAQQKISNEYSFAASFEKIQTVLQQITC